MVNLKKGNFAMFEILSPAGSFESLKAAVSAGADAVYFGGNKFNARESAENFNEEQIFEAVKYCHLRNVKVYVTLNTVVSDFEIKEIIPYVKTLNKAGVDALIIQSAGLAKAIKEVSPETEIHASTQMTIHNLDGIKNAQKQGFSRVVLSRELDEENIDYICKNSPLEIELFVHGALCMCYSGQCYMSSVIGQRSGNRGKCAQPCRQNYKNGYELSLKDLSMAKDFKKILNKNIHSLKIEGRLKSPEYVYGVTKIFRRLVDEKRNATDDEIKYLEALFSRQGFTNGYFNNSPSKKMFGIRTKEDKETTRLLEKEEYKEKKIPVDIKYDFSLKDCTLKMKHNSFYAEVSQIIAQSAIKLPLSKEEAEMQISKLGNFPFYAKNVNGIIRDDIFIPKSSLNGLKRECAELLSEKIICVKEKAFKVNAHLVENINEDDTKFNFIFEGSYPFKEIEEFAKECKHLWVDLFKYEKTEFENIGVKLPRIIFDNEKEIISNHLKALKDMGVKKALCYNLSQIEMVKETGLIPFCSFTLNAFNSYDIEFLKKCGAEEVSLSFECSLPIIKNIKKPTPVTIPVYGKLPVMVTENCIIKNAGKCINFKGNYTLTDKIGEKFTVLCHFEHRNLILNSKPLVLSDKLSDFENIGLSGFDFYFTTENTKEIKNIITSYKEKRSLDTDFTRGLYYRKV